MFVPEEHNCIHMKEESPASHLIALDTKHVGGMETETIR
jgi:hypothetical protein